MKNNQLGDKPANITWQELKDFANGIEPQFLHERVLVQISDNEYCSRLNEPYRVQNEIYINRYDSDDCGTIEELKMIKEDNGEDFNIDDYVLSFKKGHPMLWIDEE